MGFLIDFVNANIIYILSGAVGCMILISFYSLYVFFTSRDQISLAKTMKQQIALKIKIQR